MVNFSQVQNGVPVWTSDLRFAGVARKDGDSILVVGNGSPTVLNLDHVKSVTSHGDLHLKTPVAVLPLAAD